MSARLLTLALVALPTAAAASAQDPADEEVQVPVEPGRRPVPIVAFRDVTVARGLGSYVPTPGMAAGAAAADVDDDGDIDLFVPNGPGVPDRYYRNDGHGHFEDVAPQLGLDSTIGGRTALWFDADGDGDLDLLRVTDDVAASSTFSLHHQQADGTFLDVTQATDLRVQGEPGEEGHRTGLCAADFDNDGHLEFYSGSWTRPPHMFQNRGDGTFQDVSLASGVASVIAEREWQPMALDINLDGWQDLYVAIDFAPNRVWINQQNGRFVDVAPQVGADIIMHDMGNYAVDYDNDGDLDLYTTNISGWLDPFEHNVLLRNDYTHGAPLPEYRDVSYDLGVADGGWGWGCTAPDLDLDGMVELVATNGFFDHLWNPDRSLLWTRYGGSDAFVEVAEDCGSDDALWGSCLLAFDMDRDGDADLFQVCMDGRLLLLENQAPVAVQRGHWLTVRPRMDGPNSRAIGAVVRVKAGGRDMMRLISAGTSLMGQEPAEAHFGLGDADHADLVVVQFPDGTVAHATDVPADRVFGLMAP